MNRLPPLGNPQYADVRVVGLVDEERCEHLLASLDPGGWVDAGVTTDGEPAGIVDLSIRSVVAQPPHGSSGKAILRSIADVVAELNDEVWRFHLTGFAPQDRPAILRYEGAVADHFQRHVDAGAHQPTRKLSFSLQLRHPDSYRGGDLVIADRIFEEGRGIGALTVFPSFLTHEVTPVYQGTRDVLVGWVHGPTFR